MEGTKHITLAALFDRGLVACEDMPSGVAFWRLTEKGKAAAIYGGKAPPGLNFKAAFRTAWLAGFAFAGEHFAEEVTDAVD